MGSGIARAIAGVYTGTGAALSMTGDKVGFKPKRVTIYRLTTAINKAEHVEGMAAASFVKTAADGALSLVSTQGVTIQDEGFSLGTDAAVNNSGDTYRFLAEE
jgi:hypothetical protein